jgi:hypothetical protein
MSEDSAAAESLEDLFRRLGEAQSRLSADQQAELTRYVSLLVELASTPDGQRTWLGEFEPGSQAAAGTFLGKIGTGPPPIRVPAAVQLVESLAAVLAAVARMMLEATDPPRDAGKVGR